MLLKMTKLVTVIKWDSCQGYKEGWVHKVSEHDALTNQENEIQKVNK